MKLLVCDFMTCLLSETLETPLKLFLARAGNCTQARARGVRPALMRRQRTNAYSDCKPSRSPATPRSVTSPPSWCLEPSSVHCLRAASSPSDNIVYDLVSSPSNIHLARWQAKALLTRLHGLEIEPMRYSCPVLP